MGDCSHIICTLAACICQLNHPRSWPTLCHSWYTSDTENCVWRLILKHCAWRVISKHCARRPSETRQTQHFKNQKIAPGGRFWNVHGLTWPLILVFGSAQQAQKCISLIVATYRSTNNWIFITTIFSKCWSNTKEYDQAFCVQKWNYFEKFWNSVLSEYHSEYQ